jgi:hypothetical protein
MGGLAGLGPGGIILDPTGAQIASARTRVDSLRHRDHELAP